MCRNKTNLARWISLCALLAMIAIFTPQAYAQCSGSAGPAFPLAVSKGDTAVPVSLILKNTSATVADGGCGPVTASNIKLTASCADFPVGGTNPCTSPDLGQHGLGVFTVHNGTGRAGSACAGTTFTAGAPDGFGRVGFTPNATVTLPINISNDPTTECDIDFTVDVIDLPATDENTASATTIQTGQLGSATLTSTDPTTGLTGSGTGTDVTTVNFTCAVKIDKQIKCDGGSFADNGGFVSTDDGVNGCIGIVGGTGIVYQYQFQNTGNVGLTACKIDDNVLLSITTAQTLADNAAHNSTSNVFNYNSGTPEACMTHQGTNTGTVTCTCDVPLATKPTVQASDSAKHDCCGVAIDKVVTCGGQNVTSNGVDNGCVTSGASTPNGPPVTNMSFCSETQGGALSFQFKATNTGSLPIQCDFVDAGANAPASGSTVANLLIATSQTGCTPLTGVGTNGVLTSTCTTSGTDTASLVVPTSLAATGGTGCSCTGTNEVAVQLPGPVSATADVQCNTPQFTITKACDIVTPGTGGAPSTFTSNVSLTNTSSPLAALDCTVIDQTVAGTCGQGALSATACSNVNGVPTFSPTGTPIALQTNPFNLTAVSTAQVDSSATGAISTATPVCNQACAVCTPQGTAAVAASPVHGYQTQCTPPGNSCFARTPGYWAEHPHVAQEVINSTSASCTGDPTTCATSTLTNCGLTITTSQASPGPSFINFSSTEDLCSIGTDNKNFDVGDANVGFTGSTAKGWSTSPQQMQLVRQCMAAELNIVASQNATGSPFNCEAAFPKINEIYAACCSAGSICSTGAINSNGTVNVGLPNPVDCLTALGDFNGSFEGTSNPSNFPEERANSNECQDAKNNGFANFGAGRKYGPGK